jgi:hypothetical protein
MPLRFGLTYTQMKLGRAHEHLDRLKSEVARFIGSKPYIERRYDDIEKGRHVLCAEQKGTPDPIGTLVGEFAYNVRSGLDHLAWQLALLTTDKPSRLTAFPIESECPGPANKSFDEKVASIPAEALKVIESLQPYTRGPAFKDHPLWQVNKLCNIDKHQVIAVSSIDFRVAVFEVSQAWGPAYPNRHTACIAIPIAEKGQVEFRVEVAEVIFGEPIDKPQGGGSLEIGLDGLSAIYQFVRYDAVPRFEIFFPK